MIKAGIMGVTGYVGEELMRLLQNHSEVVVTRIMSETYKNQKFSSIYRNFIGLNDLVCEEVKFDNLDENIDVLFTCLPYGVLMEKLTKDILDKVKIIDLGADYRFMNKEEYKKYYGKDHTSLELSNEFTYGLSEWNRENISSARHISNPGCFATVIENTLIPLIKENVIETDNIIVDGKCSLSGAGRSLSLGTHFIEANESTKPYKIANHPHEVEAKRAIEYFTDTKTNLVFVPHIVPMQRGILITIYTKVKENVTKEAIREVYKKYYENEKFIKLLDDGMYAETKWVKNSNMCHINFTFDEESKTLITFSTIDNLMKGASGQAVQNLNIMYGLKEDMGLTNIPSNI